MIPPSASAVCTTACETSFKRADTTSLTRNYIWNLLGNAIYAGCQWGMLIALARLTDPTVVGQFVLALAITGPVMLLSNLQLRVVQATDAREEYRFSDYMRLRLTTMPLALLAIFAYTAFVASRGTPTLAINTVALAKAAEGISDVYYGRLQHYERMDVIAKSLALKGLVMLCAFTVLAFVTRSAGWAALGMCAGSLLTLWWYDLPTAKRSIPATQRRQTHDADKPWRALGRLASLALPLGFVAMLGSLNTNIPRYFVQGCCGSYNLGIFAAVGHLTVVGSIAAGALGQVVSPRLAHFYASASRAAFVATVSRVAWIVGLLTVAGILTAMIFGRVILSVLYGQDYAAQTGVFTVLTAAAGLGFFSTVLGHALSAARLFKVQALVVILVVLSIAGSAALLTPRWGLLGAATSVLIGALFQFSTHLTLLVLAISRLPNGTNACRF